MKKLVTKKRLTAIGLSVAVIAGAVAAYAYFTSTGSGSGSAQTGTARTLTIQQVGAGYDSLVSTGTYTQDQTFAGAGITEFGNDVTLANSGAQQLVNVVVAFDNWGPAIPALPITLSINNTVAGPISTTTDAAFPAAVGPATPSEENVTFDFSSQGAFVQQEFVYQISFNTSLASSLNVALSSSYNDLSVGTDTHPGTVWLSSTYSTLGNDFPACTTPITTGVWEQVTTDCGPYSPSNPGAYGTAAQVAAGSADIPAVEVNVVGGLVPPLFPGGPSQPIDFAITNPGASSVHVNQVYTTVSGLTGAGSNGSIEACSTSMYPISGSPATVNENVPPGTTIVSPSGTTIKMTDDNNNQDNCEGATVNLSFSSL